MTPDRLLQIQELFHAVQEGSAEQRAALLARADPGLRSEVESLLARQSQSLLLDRPAVEVVPESVETEFPIAVAGGCLGPYRVEGKLGEGGMGEVFRAVDTRLGRAVAIKTAHAHFSDRFEREARAISALNHPNICTLYDIGPNYLVMELLEGETLAARLKHGPLPIHTVLLYGSQIAAALVEAHGKGIVHRDLKPGNIMIGKAGVKVLDFGLACSGQDESVTASGMVMGTPAYMAPEQREGKSADARTDIYARSGRMRQARTMWERAITLAQQAGERERVAIYETAVAVSEAQFGNMAAAKERARAALRLGKGRDVEYAAAFALALSGDAAGSQSLANDLAKRFPEDTPVQFEYLPTLRALFALAHRQPAGAVEQLQVALPYDLALPGTAFFAKFGGLYPAYVRGQAYLEARQGREAAAEFQKVLDHRGIVFADPIGALAHLQLGRAYVVSGDMAKAKIAYRDFLTFWKDADADIPVLKQAKAEYAKL